MVALEEKQLAVRVRELRLEKELERARESLRHMQRQLEVLTRDRGDLALRLSTLQVRPWSIDTPSPSKFNSDPVDRPAPTRLTLPDALHSSSLCLSRQSRWSCRLLRMPSPLDPCPYLHNLQEHHGVLCADPLLGCCCGRQPVSHRISSGLQAYGGDPVSMPGKHSHTNASAMSCVGRA